MAGREGVQVSHQAAVESRQSWGKYPPMTPQKGREKPPRSGFDPLTQTHPYLPQIRGGGGGAGTGGYHRRGLRKHFRYQLRGGRGGLWKCPQAALGGGD